MFCCLADLEHKDSAYATLHQVSFPPPNALKSSFLPANLNANAPRLSSNSDAVERILQKEAVGKGEIMFGGMHCFPLIIFFFSIFLNLMSVFFYTGAVVEIINFELV